MDAIDRIALASRSILLVTLRTDYNSMKKCVVMYVQRLHDHFFQHVEVLYCMI